MNGLSGFTSKMRLSGLSGFDTESMVSELMKAERIPLDKLKQKRTLVEWRQTAYREVSRSLMDFKSKFFNVVNRSSYLLSQNSINAKTAKSSNSDYVTATAGSGATVGTQNIKVVRLATSDTVVSSGKISKDIKGTVVDKDLEGQKIIVSLDGVTKEITLENYTDDDLKAKLQSALDDAFGENKLDVSFNAEDQALKIGTLSGSTRVSVFDITGGALNSLGLTPGASNRISLKSSLVSLRDSLDIPMTFSDGGTVDISLNGKVISANATDTLENLFSKINNTPEANVRISYDEITDEITLQSKITGQGDNLKLESISGNFFEALKLSTSNMTIEGQDAEVVLNGTQTLIRSTNSFTVNGITYTLKKEHETAATGETITIEQDTESVIKNIKSFIEEYNKLIESINGKTAEKYDRDYQPLTDAQKEGMEKEDIENWEKKAKTGILRNDSLLEQITLSMRRALYEKVEGVGINLKDIGIESRSYMDNGKLYLDEAGEEKLKKALLEKPEEVAKLFVSTSSAYPTYSKNHTTEQKKERYNQLGLFQRLSDIMEDNVSTIGGKGILLIKAGIENDLTQTVNLISDDLEDYDDRIDALVNRLIRKEENYYRKFSSLETYLNRMNQQSAWLTSQLGGNS